MKFVKAQPHEYLLVGRKGRLVNRGLGASSWVFPGTSWVTVPSTQQKTHFEMTQESKDGIPLRFKGLVVYRIAEPTAAARLFDFVHDTGYHQISEMVSDLSLGELRAQVAKMTYPECVQERKTTLTQAVREALLETNRASGWGVEIEVVQVAQVFIVDQELRYQLEAEVRQQIRADSELATLKVESELQRSRAESERHSLDVQLATERERVRVKRESEKLQSEAERLTLDDMLATERERSRVQQENEKMRADLEKERLRHHSDQMELEAQLEHQRTVDEIPAKLESLKQRLEILELEKEVMERELQLKTLATQTNLLERTAETELRLKALPVEQRPMIAEALAGILRGVNLSVYGSDSGLLATLAPLLGKLQGLLDAPKEED